MYTLNSWGSQLGIVAVDLSNQEYPSVMFDPRAINKLAGFESPVFRAESARNPPCLPGFPAGIRPDSDLNPPNHFYRGSKTLPPTYPTACGP